MTDPRSTSGREPITETTGRGSADTRRFLAHVAAVGVVIVALAFVVWARACAEADRCAQAGGRWDEEWKVCRQ